MSAAAEPEEVDDDINSDDEVVDISGLDDRPIYDQRTNKSVVTNGGTMKVLRQTHPTILKHLLELQSPLVVSIELYPYNITKDDLDFENDRNKRLLDFIGVNPLDKIKVVDVLRGKSEYELTKLSAIDEFAASKGKGLSKVRLELSDFHPGLAEGFAQNLLQEINNKYISIYNDLGGATRGPMLTIDDVKLFKHVVEFVDFLSQNCNIIFTNENVNNYTMLHGYDYHGAASLDDSINRFVTSLMSKYTGNPNKRKRIIYKPPGGFSENTNISVYFVIQSPSKKNVFIMEIPNWEYHELDDESIDYKLMIRKLLITGNKSGISIQMNIARQMVTHFPTTFPIRGSSPKAYIPTSLVGNKYLMLCLYSGNCLTQTFKSPKQYPMENIDVPVTAKTSMSSKLAKSASSVFKSMTSCMGAAAIAPQPFKIRQDGIEIDAPLKTLNMEHILAVLGSTIGIKKFFMIQNFELHTISEDANQDVNSYLYKSACGKIQYVKDDRIYKPLPNDIDPPGNSSYNTYGASQDNYKKRLLLLFNKLYALERECRDFRNPVENKEINDKINYIFLVKNLFIKSKLAYNLGLQFSTESENLIAVQRKFTELSTELDELRTIVENPSKQNKLTGIPSKASPLNEELIHAIKETHKHIRDLKMLDQIDSSINSIDNMKWDELNLVTKQFIKDCLRPHIQVAELTDADIKEMLQGPTKYIIPGIFIALSSTSKTSLTQHMTLLMQHVQRLCDDEGVVESLSISESEIKDIWEKHIENIDRLTTPSDFMELLNIVIKEQQDIESKNFKIDIKELFKPVQIDSVDNIPVILPSKNSDEMADPVLSENGEFISGLFDGDKILNTEDFKEYLKVPIPKQHEHPYRPLIELTHISNYIIQYIEYLCQQPLPDFNKINLQLFESIHILIRVCKNVFYTLLIQNLNHIFNCHKLIYYIKGILQYVSTTYGNPSMDKKDVRYEECIRHEGRESEEPLKLNNDLLIIHDILQDELNDLLRQLDISVFQDHLKSPTENTMLQIPIRLAKLKDSIIDLRPTPFTYIPEASTEIDIANILSKLIEYTELSSLTPTQKDSIEELRKTLGVLTEELRPFISDSSTLGISNYNKALKRFYEMLINDKFVDNGDAFIEKAFDFSQGNEFLKKADIFFEDQQFAENFSKKIAVFSEKLDSDIESAVATSKRAEFVKNVSKISNANLERKNVLAVLELRSTELSELREKEHSYDSKEYLELILNKSRATLIEKRCEKFKEKKIQLKLALELLECCNEKTSLREQLRGAIEEKEGLEKANAKLEEDIARLREQLTTSEAKVEELTNQIGSSTSKLQELDELKAKIEELTTQLKSENSEKEELQEKIAQLEAANSSLQKKIAESQATVEKLTRDLGSANLEKEGLRQNLESRIESLQLQLSQSHEKLSQAETDHGELMRLRTERTPSSLPEEAQPAVLPPSIESELSTLKERKLAIKSELDITLNRLAEVPPDQEEQKQELNETISRLQRTIRDIEIEESKKEFEQLSASENVREPTLKREIEAAQQELSRLRQELALTHRNLRSAQQEFNEIQKRNQSKTKLKEESGPDDAKKPTRGPDDPSSTLGGAIQKGGAVVDKFEPLDTLCPMEELGIENCNEEELKKLVEILRKELHCLNDLPDDTSDQLEAIRRKIFTAHEVDPTIPDIYQPFITLYDIDIEMHHHVLNLLREIKSYPFTEQPIKNGPIFEMLRPTEPEGKNSKGFFGGSKKKYKQKGGTPSDIDTIIKTYKQRKSITINDLVTLYFYYMDTYANYGTYGVSRLYQNIYLILMNCGIHVPLQQIEVDSNETLNTLLYRVHTVRDKCVNQYEFDNKFGRGLCIKIFGKNLNYMMAQLNNGHLVLPLIYPNISDNIFNPTTFLVIYNIIKCLCLEFKQCTFLHSYFLQLNIYIGENYYDNLMKEFDKVNAKLLDKMQFPTFFNTFKLLQKIHSLNLSMNDDPGRLLAESMRPITLPSFNPKELEAANAIAAEHRSVFNELLKTHCTEIIPVIVKIITTKGYKGDVMDAIKLLDELIDITPRCPDIAASISQIASVMRLDPTAKSTFCMMVNMLNKLAKDNPDIDGLEDALSSVHDSDLSLESRLTDKRPAELKYGEDVDPHPSLPVVSANASLEPSSVFSSLASTPAASPFGRDANESDDSGNESDNESVDAFEDESIISSGVPARDAVPSGAVPVTQEIFGESQDPSELVHPSGVLNLGKLKELTEDEIEMFRSVYDKFTITTDAEIHLATLTRLSKIMKPRPEGTPFAGGKSKSMKHFMSKKSRQKTIKHKIIIEVK